MSRNWIQKIFSPSFPQSDSKEKVDEEIRPISRDIAIDRMALIHAALRQGNRSEALMLTEGLAHANPADAAVQVQLGICRYLVGDSSGAASPLLGAMRLGSRDPRAFYFLAASLMALGQHDEALIILRQGIEVAPGQPKLLTLASKVCGHLWRLDEAARYVSEALAVEPENLEALLQVELLTQQTLQKRSKFELYPGVAEARGRVMDRLLAQYRNAGLGLGDLTGLLSLLGGGPEQFGDAVEIAVSAIATEPMVPPLAVQLFNILLDAGDLAHLQRLAERCYELDPNDLTYKMALSSVWLSSGSGQWMPAWMMWIESQYRSRPAAHPHTVPYWQGQPVKDTKVLVYQDQGIGDSIMALRFLPMLAARKVRFDLWVAPALVDLVASIEGCETIIRAPTLPDPLEHGCGFAIPLFGLIPALYLGRDEIEDPPVIRPHATRAIHLREAIRGLSGVRIGLVYGGNPDRRDDWLRSLPWEFVKMLSRVDGVHWVNLMKDERPDKRRVIEKLAMLDPMPEVRDFADTASVIEELDAVVAVDGSVAHLAGNLGKPLWVLAPVSCDWRWQMGDDICPWWPTARLIRSEAPGQWPEVQGELDRQLRQFVAEVAKT